MVWKMCIMGVHWQANFPGLAPSPVTIAYVPSGKIATTPTHASPNPTNNVSSNGITGGDETIIGAAGENVETVGTGVFARLRAAGLL